MKGLSNISSEIHLQIHALFTSIWKRAFFYFEGENIKTLDKVFLSIQRSDKNFLIKNNPVVR